MRTPSFSSILRWSLLLLAAGLFFSATLLIQAQSMGAIAGNITDSQGAAIVGAKVLAHNLSTGVERTVVTESTGHYQLVSLPIGVYRVEVQAQGFQTKRADNVVVQVATTTDLDLSLVVGQLSETVNVEASAPVIESNTMEVGQTITQRTVQEIPLNGRHFVDLGLLLPGSVVQPQNGFLTAPLRGQGAFAFNTAGNREDTVNFMINGINLNDMAQNQITFQPSINTVSEFTSDNSTFSAEYGRNSGAIVNIATRSGTNQFHGEAFEFLRNNDLDANNFFANSAHLPIAPFKRNNFGFNVGGPVWLGPSHPGKDRTFFFFSYEGLRQRQGLTFNQITVPTPAQRAAVTDPTVLKLLQFIPAANIPGTNNFVGTGTAPVNIDQWTLDLSHHFSDKDTLHGYYVFQRDFRGEPNLQGNTVPGFGDTRQSHRQVFTLDETHVFNDRTVNDFRMGYNRIHIIFSPNAQLNPADFGINDGVTTNLGLPQISITGSANFGGPDLFPQGRSDTGFLWGDTLSYLVGKHSLKIGTEVRRFQNNNFSQDTGLMQFSSIPSFLAATATSFNITLGAVENGIRTTGFGLFIQDNYKVLSNLTLELGLRWDMNTTPTEVNGKFVNLNPSTGTLVRLGQGISQVYGSNNKNFGPRVGFAWDPFGTGKTSVRGGYGVYYDQPVTNAVGGLATNPPFAIPSSATGTVSLSNPLGNASTVPSLSPAAINPDFRNAYVQSWNLNVQREVMKDLGISVGYYGSKGTHLRMFHNINQPLIPGVNSSRPYSNFSNIVQVDSPSNSTYNALWASATKRISKGLQFTASYSWSHSIDWISLSSPSASTMMAQDSYNLRNERGSSDFDARHHFNVSYIYDLPFKGNRLVEGWEISGITTFQSGNPVDIIVTGAGPTGFATRRANLVGDPTLSSPTRTEWFNTAAFCSPGATGCVGPAVFGNVGRNTITGPGFNNFDWSIIKTTQIKENLKVEFRTEVFDLFNHPNFGQPGRVVGSTTFGVITNTRFPTGDSGSSRQIQFALKLLF